MTCKKCGSDHVEVYETVKDDDWTEEIFKIDTLHCFECDSIYDI